MCLWGQCSSAAVPSSVMVFHWLRLMKDFQVAHRAADHNDLGICTVLIFGWFWFLLRAQPNVNHGVGRLWGWTVVSTQAVHLMGSMGPVQLHV